MAAVLPQKKKWPRGPPSLLHLAAYVGSVERTVALLARGSTDTNLRGDDGYTPLMLAAQNGHTSVVRILLNKGADTSIKDGAGFNALILSAQNGHLSATTLLMEAGADLHAKNSEGHTPLHVATLNEHLEIMTALVEAGADLEAVTSEGYTPLHISAQNGHPVLATFLRDAGADLHATIRGGIMPVHMAALNGHLETMTALAKAGADLQATASRGITPLVLASQNGHLEVVRALVDAGVNCDARTSTGETALFLAAYTGHLDVVKVLLLATANPLLGSTDPQSGQTVLPLDSAALYGHAEVVRELVQQVGLEGCGGASGGVDALVWAAQEQQLDIMAVLTNTRVVDPGDALIVAAATGNEAAVNYFLLHQKREERGADGAAYVDASDSYGQTPLSSAVGSGRCSPRVVRLLVEAGADTTSAAHFFVTSEQEVVSHETSLDTANRCLRTKKVDGKDATEEQLNGLEGIRRLLLRVQAVHAVSWLWPNGIPRNISAAQGPRGGRINSTPLRMMLPVLRRGARRKSAVLLRALFRWVVIC